MPVARSLTLSTALGDDLLVESLSANEELGRPFEFEVGVLSEVDVALTDLLGTPATVSLELPDDRKRHFAGLVAAATLEGGKGRLSSYRLTLRPWLWLLTRRSDTRIFQEMSAEKILKQVFAAYEHTVEFVLQDTYRNYEYCVQYRETDFNFVSRLMEQEGMYYYFRHAAGGHTLVIVDKIGVHAPHAGYESIQFNDVGSVHHDRDVIDQWRMRLEVQSGAVILNDYDFKKPSLALKAEHVSQLPGAVTEYELYDPPGDYLLKADGERYATLRMEEIDARHLRIQGSGNARGIAVGHRFKLTEHPVAKQNAEYLAISTHIDARHGGYDSGSESEHYACSFTAMPTRQAFRAPRVTPKPTVPGPQTAVVVGPSGDEIYTDEFGRVKVQFHWDRLGKNDEKSSCWVRVSHPLAGKAFGMVALPRIGQEVVVDFLEGDPDRPLIVGRVYNGEQTVPYKLPDNKTVASFKSRSSLGGGAGNFNELRFEDKKGSEHIYFQAEKDFYQYVKQDAHLMVDRDQTRIVKRDLTEEIKNDVQRTVGKDVKDKIAGNLHLDLTGDSASKVAGKYGLKVTGDLVLESAAAISAKSGADMVQKVGANLGVEAAANVHIKGGANVVIEAGAMLTLKCGGGSIVIGPANVAITGAMVMINSGGGAGSGSGASPKPPAAAEAAQAPEEPKDPLAS